MSKDVTHYCTENHHSSFSHIGAIILYQGLQIRFRVRHRWCIRPVLAMTTYHMIEMIRGNTSHTRPVLAMTTYHNIIIVTGLPTPTFCIPL